MDRLDSEAAIRSSSALDLSIRTRLSSASSSSLVPGSNESPAVFFASRITACASCSLNRFISVWRDVAEVIDDPANAVGWYGWTSTVDGMSGIPPGSSFLSSSSVMIDVSGLCADASITALATLIASAVAAVSFLSAASAEAEDADDEVDPSLFFFLIDMLILVGSFGVVLRVCSFGVFGGDRVILR